MKAGTILALLAALTLGAFIGAGSRGTGNDEIARPIGYNDQLTWEQRRRMAYLNGSEAYALGFEAETNPHIMGGQQSQQWSAGWAWREAHEAEVEAITGEKTGSQLNHQPINQAPSHDGPERKPPE
tara:strand:- start:24852 stop:25229 length:378 start_codon:yes stop_codon:yes gene_type:complete